MHIVSSHVGSKTILVDVVFIACYLITCMPSYVLNGQILYSDLCPQIDLFPLTTKCLNLHALYTIITLIKLSSITVPLKVCFLDIQISKRDISIIMICADVTF